MFCGFVEGLCLYVSKFAVESEAGAWAIEVSCYFVESGSKCAVKVAEFIPLN